MVSGFPSLELEGIIACRSHPSLHLSYEMLVRLGFIDQPSFPHHTQDFPSYFSRWSSMPACLKANFQKPLGAVLLPVLLSGLQLNVHIGDRNGCTLVFGHPLFFLRLLFTSVIHSRFFFFPKNISQDQLWRGKWSLPSDSG